VQLAPDEQLRLEEHGDRFVCVLEGVVYVTFREDDVLLMPGDQLVIHAGEAHRAWNAGDEPARVVVGERSAALHA
jgi:quercetin dioxygenase-like cupin family protein